MKAESFVQFEVRPVRHAWSSIGRSLLGLSLVVVLTFVATPGVIEQVAPQLEHTTPLVDPPDLD